MLKSLNNYSFQLTSTLSNSATVLAVSVGVANDIITHFDDDYFYLTLTDGVSFEVVKITSKSGTNLFIDRGVDGTAALTWPSGTNAEFRVPSGMIEDLRESGVTGFSRYDGYTVFQPEIYISDSISMKSVGNKLFPDLSARPGLFYPTAVGYIVDSITNLTTPPQIRCGSSFSSSTKYLGATATVANAVGEVARVEIDLNGKTGDSYPSTGVHVAAVADDFFARMFIEGYHVPLPKTYNP